MRFDGACQVTLADALRKIPGPGGRRFAEVFGHGTLRVEIYAPRGRDLQSAHTRDEVYVVVSGSGMFVCGGERVAVTPGDVLFAPAGIIHRFEDFTEDLVVWVFFYGPEGGELVRGGEH